MGEKEVLCALSEMTPQEDGHVVERLRALGYGRGDGRQSKLCGTNRRCANQQMTGVVSRKTLTDILAMGAEHIWVCPECNDAGSASK